MSKVDYCTPPPHVVTYPVLAIVMAAFVSLAGGFGAFAYGQARDAGNALGPELEAHKIESAEVHRIIRAELAAQSQTTQRTELRAQRSEVMLEMLLRNSEIRPPPPVALDGGQ